VPQLKRDLVGGPDGVDDALMAGVRFVVVAEQIPKDE
jgi:hypothetical protein